MGVSHSWAFLRQAPVILGGLELLQRHEVKYIVFEVAPYVRTTMSLLTTILYS